MGFFKKLKELTGIDFPFLVEKLDEFFINYSMGRCKVRRYTHNEHYRYYFESLRHPYFMCRAEINSVMGVEDLPPESHLLEKYYAIFERIKNPPGWNLIADTRMMPQSEVKKLYKKLGGTSNI